MSNDVLTISDKGKWNDYLKLLPKNQQDVYFTPEYYSLYERNGDGEVNCFIFEKDGNIVLYPFLKNSINQLGYSLDDEYFDIQGAYGYNGMLSSSDDTSFLNDFWHTFDQFCKDNNIVAEFTRFHPILKNHSLGNGHFDIIFDRKTVFLDLKQSEDEIFAGLRKSTRKHILKASQTIEIRKAAYTEENVDTFFSIYVENMKKVNSIPYLFFSREHFMNMFKLDNIEFFIAYLDDQPIACYSGLVSKEYYGNYLRASLTEYNKTGVNPLMYWSMIQSAKNHGCQFVHFGGGTNGDLDNTLLQYKMNFSQTLTDFYIGKKIHNKEVYSEVLDQWRVNYPDSFARNKKKQYRYSEIYIKNNKNI